MEDAFIINVLIIWINVTEVEAKLVCKICPADNILYF